MQASPQLIIALKVFEGFRAKAYKCPAGVWSIGYGHTSGVKAGQVVSTQKATQLLTEDVATVCRQLERLHLPALTQGQQDAIIDFCFNLGVGKFQQSTLFRKIKANPKDASIANEFSRWVYAGGKKMAGLVTRRQWENARWFS